MDSEHIEQVAVNAVKLEVLKDECLSPYISEHDKEPSWDGHIYVYKSKRIAKDNIERRVPVQVKGKEVKRFGNKKRSFQCDVSDLVNFLNDGGCFLFVVEIKESMETKIYYADLLPIDINAILNKTNKSQGTKSVIVKVLKPQRLRILLLNFILNKEKQIGRKPISVENINKLYEMNFEVKSNNNNPLDLIESEIPVYGRFNSQDQFAPIESRLQIESIVTELRKSVYIEGKKYYDNYSVETKKDKKSLNFGKCICLDISDKTCILHFSYKGNIYESQLDCMFIVDFLTSGIITIENDNIPLLTEDNKERKLNIQKFTNILEYFNNVINIFNYFGIKVNKNLSAFSKNDFKQIDILIDIVLNHKKPINLDLQTGIIKLTICNISFACIGFLENGNYYLYNYFSDFYNKYKITSSFKDNPSQSFEVFPYIYLKAHDIIDLSNFNCVIVLSSIKKIKFTKPSAELTNSFLLEIILAYDENKSDNLLNLSENIANILLKINPNYPIFMINRLQIIKRKRSLNYTEKELLYDIKNRNKDDFKLISGISILLENYSDFEINFKKLSPNEKKVFKKFPIYNLLKKTES